MSAHEITLCIGTSDGPIDCPVWLQDSGGIIQTDHMHGTARCTYTVGGQRCGTPAQQRAEWRARPDRRTLLAFVCPAHLAATCNGEGWLFAEGVR